VLPVGNAGNITAYWKGYQEYRAANQTTRSPRMMGFQAAGAAPIVHGHIVDNPQTVATAIRIGNPASWQAALAVVKESSGAIDAVTDEEILQAYTMVAGTEGVFCEPASAASVAGVVKLGRQGALREGDTVVCTLTGHGLKDADTAISVSVQPKTVQATKEDVARLLKV
jgi:threonine synthase